FVVVRWDVVPVFVEADFAVVVAHVDLELFRCLSSLPAIVGIAQAEVALRRSKPEAAFGQKFQIKKSEQRAAKMREVGDAPLRWLKRRNQHDEDQDADEVLRLYGKWKGEEEYLAIAIQHAKRDQQPVDSARRSHRGGSWSHAPADVSNAYR